VNDFAGTVTSTRPDGQSDKHSDDLRTLTLTHWHFVWYYILYNVMGAGMESAITVKGQATIPKTVREHLGLKPGDRVKFFMHPDGSVVLLPKLPAMALRGMVKASRQRPVSIHEMTKAAAEGAAGEKAHAKRR
jgi:AbrB family looped-hinge helix DNA binding protein